MTGNAADKPAFYQQQALRFHCTQCGQCCRGKGSYVFLTRQESDSIADFIGLSRDWFRRKYVQRLVDGELVLTQHDDGDCIYLDQGGRCRIYPVRPLQCRTYPFWPELMTSESSWLAEKKRCEGIDSGETVPVHKILDILAQFDDPQE